MEKNKLIEELSKRYEIITSIDIPNVIKIKTKVFGLVKYRTDRDVVIVNKNSISCGYKWIIQQLLKD